MNLLHLKKLSKFVSLGTVVLFFLLISSKPSYAVVASFQAAKDTITTSRPSPSSPLSANAAVGDGTISIFNNGSFFLASDSAKIIRNAGSTITNTGLIVASQSGALTSVYLGNTVGTVAGAGADVLFVPIYSMHTVQFQTRTDIPSGGDIQITFPGSGSNAASPSATTFSFNGLITANIKTNNATTCTMTINSNNNIKCVTSALISAGTVVTFLIGCSSASGASCTTQAPTLLNPTKTRVAGTADIWKIALQSETSGGVILDSSSVSIGTIESVNVHATVDPTLTFTITGTTTSTDNVNFGNTNGCLDSEPTSTGIASTSTDVNMGTLSNTPAVNTTIRNINAQRIDITTNGVTGYTLTATSSGHLVAPETGFFLNDNTTPTSFPAGTNFFGVHACGLDVLSGSGYVEGGGAGGASCLTQPAASSSTECRYAWPTVATSIPIASTTTGPVGVNAATTGSGITSIAYAAGVDASVPPGQYRSVITYVATPSF